MDAKDFYRENIAFLARRFGDFRHEARFFMAPVPFEVRYDLYVKKKSVPAMTLRPVKAPIPIGALLLCWESCPELFRVRGGKDGETEGMIYSFNGSPLSGANDWSAVSLDTGDTFSGKGDPNFKERCAVLNDAVIQSEEAVEAFVKKKGAAVIPATLEELVDWLKAR